MGETLLVGSCSGIFYAFDAASGDLVWSYDTASDGKSAQFHGNPLVFGKWVITPTDSTEEGYTYAFEIATGKLRWKQATDGGGGVITDLIGVDRTAVGVTRSGDLVGFGLDDGFMLWSFSPDAYTYRDKWPVKPDIADGRIVFGGADGAVYAVDADTGERIWKTELGAPVSMAIRVHREDVYVGLGDFRLVRLRLADGQPVWDVPLEGQPAGFPLVRGNTMVFLTGFEYDAHEVVAFDLGHGEEKWRAAAGKTTWSTVRLFPWRDCVLAGTEDGTLKAFDLGDGTVRWTLSLEGRLRGMGSSEDRVYVGTIGGMLYALDRSELGVRDAGQPAEPPEM